MSFLILSVIIVLIITLIAIVLLVPLTIEVEYKKNVTENKVTAKVKYMGITIDLLKRQPNQKHKADKPQKEAKKLSFSEVKQAIEKGSDIFSEIREDIVHILEYLSRRAVRVNLIKLHIVFGFDDAMYTGMMTGLLNGVAYNVLGLLHHHLTIQKWDVVIQPDFYTARFDIETQGILKIKNVHIMYIGVKMLKLYFKARKNSRQEK